MNEQIWWYTARASGIVAWGLLTAAVLWGIFLSTDLFPKRRRPAWLLDLHRWLGGLTLSFMGLHMLALVADSYVEFGVSTLLVPFASEWKPAPVALGVVAMWVLVAVEATSLAKRRLKKETWRRIHLVSYLAFWLGSLHGTLAGTDATHPMYLATSTLSVVAVVFALGYRVLNGKKRRTRSPRPERTRTDPVSANSGVGGF